LICTLVIAYAIPPSGTFAVMSLPSIVASTILFVPGVSVAFLSSTAISTEACSGLATFIVISCPLTLAIAVGVLEPRGTTTSRFSTLTSVSIPFIIYCNSCLVLFMLLSISFLVFVIL
jgi:hypothetical protein